jgi:hypothetical protein
MKPEELLKRIDDEKNALVAQRIEHLPPKQGAQVRVLAGAPTKPLPEEGTIEQILSDITSGEDPDASVVVWADSTGGARVVGYDMCSDIYVSDKKTLKEALIEFGRRMYEKHPPFDEFDEERYKFDWRRDDSVDKE